MLFIAISYKLPRIYQKRPSYKICAIEGSALKLNFIKNQKSIVYRQFSIDQKNTKMTKISEKRDYRFIKPFKLLIYESSSPWHN